MHIIVVHNMKYEYTISNEKKKNMIINNNCIVIILTPNNI